MYTLYTSAAKRKLLFLPVIAYFESANCVFFHRSTAYPSTSRAQLDEHSRGWGDLYWFSLYSCSEIDSVERGHCLLSAHCYLFGGDGVGTGVSVFSVALPYTSWNSSRSFKLCHNHTVYLQFWHCAGELRWFFVFLSKIVTFQNVWVGAKKIFLVSSSNEYELVPSLITPLCRRLGVS